MVPHVLFSKGMVIELVLLFWAGSIAAGVEAARGVLSGGGKGDVLLDLLRCSTGVLNSFGILEFGCKSSCFVLTVVVDSEGCLSEELFWILLEVETTCTCPVLPWLVPETNKKTNKKNY